jgi:hypothetical protein
VSTSLAVPTRKSASEPTMLAAVAAASPLTMSFPRTYTSPKRAKTMMTR